MPCRKADDTTPRNNLSVQPQLCTPRSFCRALNGPTTNEGVAQITLIWCILGPPGEPGWIYWERIRRGLGIESSGPTCSGATPWPFSRAACGRACSGAGRKYSVGLSSRLSCLLLIAVISQLVTRSSQHCSFSDRKASLCKQRRSILRDLSSRHPGPLE